MAVVYSVVWILVENVQNWHEQVLPKIPVHSLRKKWFLLTLSLIYCVLVILIRILNEAFTFNVELLIDWLRELIQLISRYNSTFQRIRMNDIGQSMHYNSTTTFFSHVLISIFGIHMFLWKITIIILESFMIHWEHLTKYLALYLLYEVINCISVNKTTFFGVMSMQIKIKTKSVLFA